MSTSVTNSDVVRFRGAGPQIAGGTVCVRGEKHRSPRQRHHCGRAVDRHRGVCLCVFVCFYMYSVLDS